MATFLKVAPTDQTDQTTAEREQSMASGHCAVPTLPLLITETAKHGAKSPSTYVHVGVSITAIFVGESLCKIKNNS